MVNLEILVGVGEGEVNDAVAELERDSTLRVTLSNASSASAVGWKCKTNNARCWTVKPNGGCLDPGASVDVVLALNSRAADGLEFDRHLVISAALSPEEAVQLRELRERTGRGSIAALNMDNPAACQTRITPVVPPGGAGGAGTGGGGGDDDDEADAVAAAARAALSSWGGIGGAPLPIPMPAAARELVTPLQSPAPGQHAADAAAQALARRMSVASRVAELHRLYPTEMQQQMQRERDQRVAEVELDTAVCAAATGTPTKPVGAAGTPARSLLGRAAAGAPPSSAASDAGGGGLFALGRGRDDLVGYLLRLLGVGRAEFGPWLSWKVYDILWAAALLWLGRRIRWVKRLQETLDL